MPVPRADPPRAAARLREVGSSPVREILALTARPGVISFAGGLPAPELFDVTGLREAYARALADDVAGRHLQYSATEGDPGLRELIAARLGARGLPTAPTDVLVTAGSQQALALTATVLVEPGDPVLVEEPSYLAVLQCFGLAGARLVPVPCDDTGLIPEAVAQAVADHAPKLLYTVPNFHNPTGRTLPLARRRPSPPWPASAGCGSSRTTPTASCATRASRSRRSPACRAPRTARSRSGRCRRSPRPGCASAGCARRRRCAVSWSWPSRPPTCTWACLPGGRDATALLGRALAHDVAFVPGRPFFAGPADRATLRLSFTAHAPGEIAEGLRRLGRVGAAAQASSS